jgi:SAM-dependent methyltransferase
LLTPEAHHNFDLDAFGGRMAHAWTGLLTAVRTGRTAYPEIFGRPFWDDVEAHSTVAEGYDIPLIAWLKRTSSEQSRGAPGPDILPDGDWASVRTIVDVGGGTGSQLAVILRAHSHLRGTLLDLPATVARSHEVFAEVGVSDRVSTVAQSFFDVLPAGADVYVLRTVISDWPDREALRILRRCADAARPDGRVIILNSVSPDEDGPADPALLKMVLVGGRMRTLTEFCALASHAGLEVSATGRQATGRFIVECRSRPWALDTRVMTASVTS